MSLSTEDREQQIGNPGKYLSRLNLGPFNPKNEREFEDWLDEADAQVMAKRVCPELMLEAWAAAAPVHLRKEIRECVKLSGLEETADELAKSLFGYSEYVRELEVELLKGTPRRTVAESIKQLERNGARFVRLRRRWGRQAIISNPNIREAFLNSLTPEVRRLVLINFQSVTLPQIISSAVAAEKLLIREGAKRVHFPKENETFVANPMMDDPIPVRGGNSAPRDNRNQRRPIRTNCSVCGQFGHLNKDCPYRNSRCASCGLIGHVSAACRNLVVKDNRGTVRTLIQNKPSETAITTKKDHTTQDRLNMASDVIEGITKLVTDRSNRGREIRAQKAASNPERQRTAIPHPVALATTNQNQSQDSDDDHSIGLAEMFCCDEGTDASMMSNSIEKNLAVIASINGVELEVVVDTGASASMCSEEIAWRCGLIATRINQKFTGLGPVTATLTEPCEVKVGSRKTLVSFYVAPGIGARPLIGIPALKDLKVLIDPLTRNLRDADPLSYGKPINLIEENPHQDGVVVVPLFDKEESEIEQVIETVKEKTNHLEQVDVEQIIELLMKHQKMWTGFTAGRVTSQTATLRVSGHPIRQKLRHLTTESRVTLEKHLEEMLKAGVIRPSKSAWASCPVFVKKKGTDRLRLCLDYRQVNEQLSADAYPLPLLWDRVQAAAGFSWYVCLDLNTAFWNIPLSEESKPITALITHKGLFEFNVLPFGIKTCPSMFQRALDSTIGHLQHKNVLCYLDDIVICGDDKSIVLKLVDEVLTLLEKAGFQLRPDKCEWLHPEVKLLGFIVNKRGIKPNHEKVKAIHQARPPKTSQNYGLFWGRSDSCSALFRTSPNSRPC